MRFELMSREHMKLVLAAVLAIGIPVCAQMDQHVQPIPNWKDPPVPQTDTSGVGQLVGVHVCVIVEDNGTDYSYVGGDLPRGAKPPTQFSDSDIHKIIAARGWVKILKHGYSADDLARERRGCMEGSKIVTPSPAEKP